MTGLQSLPLEIHHRILLNLATPDLASLARTCKLFQSPSESLIWNKLDLASFPIRPHGDETPETAHVRRCEERLQSMLAGLVAKTYRVPYVRHVRVQVTGLSFMGILELLDMVKHTLVSLECTLTPARLLFHWHKSTNAMVPLRRHLRETIVQFPVLKHLRIPLDYTWQSSAEVLLGMVPNLETLSISRLEYWSTVPSHLDLSDLHLKKLHTLEIDLMIEEYVNRLLEILQRCPTIRKIRLWTAYGLRRRPWWGEVMTALSQYQGLEKLDVQSMIPLGLEHGGFTSVKELTLRVEHKECYALILNKIEIPPLPNLETLTVVPDWSRSTSQISAPENLYSCRKSRKAAEVKGWQSTSLSADTLQNILAAPRVLRIKLAIKPTPQPAFHPHPQETMDQEEVLIRTYRSENDEWSGVVLEVT